MFLVFFLDLTNRVHFHRKIAFGFREKKDENDVLSNIPSDRVHCFQTLWEGPCMVRTAPQGLEVFRPMANPEEPNKAIMTIDYYSVEVRLTLNCTNNV